MNPYQTPGDPTANNPHPVPAADDVFRPSGRPCPHCGSTSTGKDTISHSSPSILFVIFFGWIFLLIRTAFSKQTDRCRDCGETNAYKSTSSKVALVVLIVLVTLIALGTMEPAP